MPSSPSGRAQRTSGTASPAAKMSGKPMTTSARTGGLWHEPQPGLQHGDAGALGADQRAGDVEAVLGQQLVEIVAGDAARNFRIARADQVGVAARNASSRR